MPVSRVRRTSLLTVAAAALLLLCACGDRAAGAPDQRGDRGRPIPVAVETVREQPWIDSLRALGTVQARESVTLTAKVSETVQEVHFESGQEVRRGAPL